MVQCRNKIDRMNVRRVKPFEEDLDNEYPNYNKHKYDSSPLSQTLTLRLLVPKLTTRFTSQALK
jgi:hypothetical protein